MKRPFEAASPLNDGPGAAAPVGTAWGSEKSGSVGTRNPSSGGRGEKDNDEDSQDNKRAMR